ncbi:MULTISPECIES: hypothetical protein [unclassified Rhizobium]|uniref:hypothetical protein n=1 Tax=unclassified Rhizobium TaxID=2613769 RepID=UPI001ADB19F2|nr:MULTISPECIES: hypothetical protein [unclassified Rhizobium]MBO9127509.1 hypothetical protein [Rhizobium sp. 16-488-2b]MBO9177952.1 hypothetical protein [Rhizobium sp. 16-488-2a]
MICLSLPRRVGVFDRDPQQIVSRYVGRTENLSGLGSETINLSVLVQARHGDRSADMTIQRVGADAIRIRTTNRDPTAGLQVVTSVINLRRRLQVSSW